MNTTTQFSIKYRPRTFQDIAGQPFVQKELIKRARAQTWPRAMLLKGPFGTGKTTAAHIIAMAIQSGSYPIDYDTAGVQAILNETFDRDTLMLDGSQLGGKDSVVDFTSTINVTPMYDRARVYIIEEADQLSKQAANALLKVLEQPRDNIHFILLSMETNGVSGALQSRCQTFKFKPVLMRDTMVLLKKLLEKEGLWDDESIPKEFKMEGLAAIAGASKGSLREATQLLERAITGEYFTVDQIRDELGIVDEDTAYRILQNLCNGSFDTSTMVPFFTTDPAELFNYLTVVLSNAVVFKYTNYVHDDRFRTSTATLANLPYTQALHDTLMNSYVAAKPYVRRADLLHLIYEFAKTTQADQSQRTQGIPTRRIQSR